MLHKKFSRQTLYAVAAFVWIFAGIKVLLISYHVWDLAAGSRLYWLLGAFFFFNFLVFPRVVCKNIQSIKDRGEDRLPLYHCFTKESWLIMGVMMTFGIVVRYSGYASYEFIAGFYAGLGISLIGAVRFYLLDLVHPRR